MTLTAIYKQHNLYKQGTRVYGSGMGLPFANNFYKKAWGLAVLPAYKLQPFYFKYLS